MKHLSIFTVTILMVAINSLVIARQTTTYQGKITDEKSLPIPGAQIRWSGNFDFVFSDTNGLFAITQNSDSDSLLIVSAEGFSSQTISAQTQPLIIILSPTLLPEVMVTALGIKAEPEKAGYVLQQVEGNRVEKTAPLNPISGLAGWVAGAQVVSGNTGPGSSARIILRGESSLAGGNEPLIVVDGIPIQNSRGMSRVDYGNAASFFNSSDIASVTVLKGPAAAALYGARAGNGVIMISTKSGKKGQALKVELQSEFTWESPVRTPQFQTTYGQGFNGQFAFEDGLGGGIADALDENWGPIMDGQLIPQFDSPTSNGFRGGDTALENRGEIIPTPFTSQPDQFSNFLQTGFTHRQQISLSGGTDKSTYRFGLGIQEAEGMVPNTDYFKHSLHGNLTHDLTERLKISTSLMLSRSGSNNRIPANYGSDHLLYYFIGIGRQVQLNSLKDYWQTGLEGIQQFNSNYSWLNNPYFLVSENRNEFEHLRFTGNISLHYQISDQLSLMVRSGRDSYNEKRNERKAYSTRSAKQGYYSETDIDYSEINSDALLTYKNGFLNNTLDVEVSLGASRMARYQSQILLAAGRLRLPGIYNLANASGQLSTSVFDDERFLHSIYAFWKLGYKNQLFVEVTGRNDWSSSLPKDNNSFFYPAVSATWSADQTITLPELFSSLRLRVAHAQTGREAAPLQVNEFNGLVPLLEYDDTPVYTEQGTLPSPDLRAEQTVGNEFGLMLGLLNDRFTIDITRYRQFTRDQVVTLPVSEASGYSNKVFNSGEIRNEGWEIIGQFSWLPADAPLQVTTRLNWSTNKNKVVTFPEGLDQLPLLNRDVVYGVLPGGSIGDFYGLNFQYTEDGQLIHLPNGYAAVDETPARLGNYNPKWLAGMYNEVHYKNWSLAFLLDYRYGGQTYSQLYSAATNLGSLGHTVNYRENGIISEGVIPNGDGTFRPNDVRISAVEYYKWWYRSYSLSTSIFDASYLKLRSLELTYAVPQKWLAPLKLTSATFTLVGRNLAFWTNVPEVDPEVLSVNGNRLVPGYDDLALPPARSYGMRLNVQF